MVHFELGGSRYRLREETEGPGEEALMAGVKKKQLEKLELGGVLVSHTAGRTRLYGLNPRYPFLKELRSLLEKALSFYPSEERERLLMNRRRPRRRGKPL